jgi:hypothetical protein
LNGGSNTIAIKGLYIEGDRYALVRSDVEWDKKTLIGSDIEWDRKTLLESDLKGDIVETHKGANYTAEDWIKRLIKSEPQIISPSIIEVYVMDDIQYNEDNSPKPNT